MNKIIIWDWNGTILNDVKANLNIINKLLEDRCIEKIDFSKYRKLFKMPIVEFYKDLGFFLKKKVLKKLLSNILNFIKVNLKTCICPMVF